MHPTTGFDQTEMSIDVTADDDDKLQAPQQAVPDRYQPQAVAMIMANYLKTRLTGPDDKWVECNFGRPREKTLEQLNLRWNNFKNHCKHINYHTEAHFDKYLESLATQKIVSSGKNLILNMKRGWNAFPTNAKLPSTFEEERQKRSMEKNTNSNLLRDYANQGGNLVMVKNSNLVKPDHMVWCGLVWFGIFRSCQTRFLERSNF